MTRLLRLLAAGALAAGALGGTAPAQAVDKCLIAPWTCYVCVRHPCYPPFTDLCELIDSCRTPSY